MLDLVFGHLSGEPFGEFGETLVEFRPWLEAELVAAVRDVREAMADIAGAVFSDHMRPYVRAVHDACKILRDGQNGAVLAGADVERFADAAFGFQREQAGARNVRDVDEVPL